MIITVLAWQGDSFLSEKTIIVGSAAITRRYGSRAALPPLRFLRLGFALSPPAQVLWLTLKSIVAGLSHCLALNKSRRCYGMAAIVSLKTH